MVRHFRGKVELSDQENTLYEIAYAVGIPVYVLCRDMPYSEFVGWIDFFNRRPIGWREDDRTYKLMATFGAKEKPWVLFDSLNRMHRHEEEKAAMQNITSSFAGSGMFAKIRGAKGGEKIGI